MPVAREAFDAVLGLAPHQKGVGRSDMSVTAPELLDLRFDAKVTLAGVRTNVDVALQYLDAWLSGNGAAAIYNLMEDAATAEISRSQLWQWIYHDHITVDGEQITRELVERLLIEVLAGLPRPEGHRLIEAEDVFRTVTLREDFPTFLTVPAYARFLVEREEPVWADLRS